MYGLATSDVGANVPMQCLMNNYCVVQYLARSQCGKRDSIAIRVFLCWERIFDFLQIERFSELVGCV